MTRSARQVLKFLRRKKKKKAKLFAVCLLANYCRNLANFIKVEVFFLVDIELKTHNCRNLTIFQELVVSIVVTLLTHEVVEVEGSQLTSEVIETKKLRS